ncbi:MAG: hypothetical protein IH840_04760 [Candidatus Heimdallarchaeota archaeon]|nr:hypothetical protein [Candidatus Heimdallarchaeota archaeon]
MNILAKTARLNKSKSEVWDVISELANNHYLHQITEGIVKCIDCEFGIKSGEVDFFHDGGYYTERVSLDPDKKTVRMHVVRGHAGPTIFSVGNIEIDEIEENETEVTLDFTYDQYLGLFGKLTKAILIDSLFEALSFEIMMSIEENEASMDRWGNERGFYH